MVLLFFAAAVFLICLLWKIKVLFYAQVQDDFLRMHAELRLLFGVIRIPMDAEAGICEMIGRRNKRKKKKKRPERKRFLRLLLSKGRENGALRLSSFTCRGLIGNADDAFLSAYSAPGDVRGIIDDIVLPESMPENHYFVSTARLNEAVETYLLEEEILMKEENLKYYLRGLPQIIKNMIVAREGALSVAASAILQAGECMILPDIPFEPGFIVFDAGEANTIIVSMSLAGEDIVSFNASVVSREALSLLTDMEALMDEMM